MSIRVNGISPKGEASRRLRRKYFNDEKRDSELRTHIVVLINVETL